MDGHFRASEGRRRVAAGVLFAMVVSLLMAVDGWSVSSAALLTASKFVPLPPSRVLDSRLGLGYSGAAPPGGTVTLPMLGRGGVPVSGVAAVLLNVTLAEAQGPGFVQVFPTGMAAVGASSNLNIEFANQTIPNLAVAPLGVGGMVSIHTQGGGHLIADVFGYFVESGATRDGRYVRVFPNRLLDTRPSGKLAAGGTVRVQVAGRGGVPAGVTAAAVLNVTATQASDAGYVQVLPSGTAQFGGYSNLNVVTGQTIPNLVVVPVGADGSVTVFSERGTHVIVDLFGYFTNEVAPESTGGLFVALSPTRLLDTRGGAMRAGGSVTAVTPRGRAGIPDSGVAAVFGNVTATDSANAAYVQAVPGPASTARTGLWSNVNIERSHQTIANAAIANLGTDGDFLLYTSGAAHLLFDASGYFTGNDPAPSPPAPAGKPCVVSLHAKGGGGQPEWTGSDGVRHSFPGGNADGWGGRQWLYYPESNYETVRGIVANDVIAGGCGRVVVDGFSNGAAFAAKLYCRGETFGGTVVGYIIDDPVVDHAVEGCSHPPVNAILYWTGDVDQADGWPCGDWTCEGESTIGIARYEAAMGLVRTPSIYTVHRQYEDPPELHSWLN